MNIWAFTGNLGKDAKIMSTQNGKTICQFSVAVASGYGDNQKTTWVQCAIFGKRAEGQLPQYLTTGQKVAITGEAYLDEWQDQSGQTQKIMKVIVGTIDLIGDKQASQPQQAPQQPQQGYQQPQQRPAPPPQGQPQGVHSQQAPQQPPPQGFNQWDDDSLPF